MIVALEVLPSLTNCLLVVVMYVLRLGVSFNNLLVVTIILLFDIRCPTSSLTPEKMGASNTSRCSITDGNPAHSMDQGGFETIATFCFIVIFHHFITHGQSLTLVA